MALAINPQNTTALNQQTNALVGLGRWRDSEENSRHTLEVAPHNLFAAQLLAFSLQRLGKLEESRAVNAMVLAQIPNNAWAHIQAGWGSLRAGDHQDADFHFREALRLDPHIEAARKGLIASLNSRVWIFRRHYQFRDWLAGHHSEVQGVLLFGGIALFRVVILYMNHFDVTWKLWGSVGLVFFVLLGYAGNHFANFFLLLDPFARLALTGAEKGYAACAGLSYLFVLAVFCFSMCWPQAMVLAIPPALFLWAVLLPQIGKKSRDTV
jgi:tetratricopeptide (TPR) repeat protein